MTNMNRSEFATLVLSWYEQHQRVLPWRYTSDQTPDPYYVWLSEIMLQQTQVDTVIPYFNAFIFRWPRVQDLAGASIDDVLHAWQGLGYYARARNLHACAQRVTLKGGFPSTQEELQTLPGIGPYASAAIAAIAFQQASVVVDGNVARIMSRVFGFSKPIKQNTNAIYEMAEKLTPKLRVGDYAQALMDIGSGVCRPTQPKCDECPVRVTCVAGQSNDPASFPKKPEKKILPTRLAVAYGCVRGDKVLLRQRTHHKMLNRLWELPGSNWEQDCLPELPEVLGGCFDIKHTFSHFHLITRTVQSEQIDEEYLDDSEVWIQVCELDQIAISTLTKKMLKVLLKKKDSLF